MWCEAIPRDLCVRLARAARSSLSERERVCAMCCDTRANEPTISQQSTTTTSMRGLPRSIHNRFVERRMRRNGKSDIIACVQMGVCVCVFGAPESLPERVFYVFACVRCRMLIAYIYIRRNRDVRRRRVRGGFQFVAAAYVRTIAQERRVRRCQRATRKHSFHTRLHHTY